MLKLCITGEGIKALCVCLKNGGEKSICTAMGRNNCSVEMTA